MLTGFDWFGIYQVADSGRSYCLVAGSSVSWWTKTVPACWFVCNAHCTSRILSEIAWRWWCMTPCTLIPTLGRNLLPPSLRCKQPTRCHISEDSLSERTSGIIVPNGAWEVWLVRNQLPFVWKTLRQCSIVFIGSRYVINHSFKHSAPSWCVDYVIPKRITAVGTSFKHTKKNNVCAIFRWFLTCVVICHSATMERRWHSITEVYRLLQCDMFRSLWKENHAGVLQMPYVITD